MKGVGDNLLPSAALLVSALKGARLPVDVF